MKLLKQDTRLWFWCPGCEDLHTITFNKWAWNGDLDNPTITPSILTTNGHYIDNNKTRCWCNFEERSGQKSSFKCRLCHMFITDGQMKFLNDCSHELAGQTIALGDIPQYVLDQWE
jgi:hypothetical protein